MIALGPFLFQDLLDQKNVYAKLPAPIDIFERQQPFRNQRPQSLADLPIRVSKLYGKRLYALIHHASLAVIRGSDGKERKRQAFQRQPRGKHPVMVHKKTHGSSLKARRYTSSRPHSCGSTADLPSLSARECDAEPTWTGLTRSGQEGGRLQP